MGITLRTMKTDSYYCNISQSHRASLNLVSIGSPLSCTALLQWDNRSFLKLLPASIPISLIGGGHLRGQRAVASLWHHVLTAKLQTSANASCFLMCGARCFIIREQLCVAKREREKERPLNKGLKRIFVLLLWRLQVTWPGPPAVTAQRLVLASNPLAQPVPPHAAASLPSCRPGLYEVKSFPQSGEEGARKETGSELQIKSRKIILCLLRWCWRRQWESSEMRQRTSHGSGMRFFTLRCPTTENTGWDVSAAACT